MENITIDNHPVIKTFKSLCHIPHYSGNEKKLGNYIINLLKQNNLWCKVDKFGNIYAKKDGNTSAPSILLQAHLDMVYAKRPNSNHKKETDPIVVLNKNGFLTAKETSLGADNGIGVAMILSLLCDKTISHGPLEVAFTVAEETTTIGAVNLLPNVFKSKYLINLDSESDQSIYIGSCQCITEDGIFPIKKEKRINDSCFLQLSIKGAKGGHSGIDIHKPHDNPITTLFALLQKLNKKFYFSLVDTYCDAPENAIPKEYSLVINIISRQKNSFIDTLKQLFKSHFKTISSFEPDVKLFIKETRSNKSPLTKESFNELLKLVASAPHGSLQYNKVEKIAELSTNFSRVCVGDKTANVCWLHRSMHHRLMQSLLTRTRKLLSSVRGKTSQRDELSGWEPDWNNKLAKLVKDLARKQFNHNMTICAVNGGLETGEIMKKYPKLLSISIGPTIHDCHTYNERVKITSIIFIYKLMTKVLLAIKKNATTK